MQHRRRLLRLAALLPVLCFASCGGEEESGVERWIMDLDATVERAREQLMAIPGVNPQEVDTQVGAFRLELLQAPDYRLRLAQDQSFVLSVTGPGFEGRTLSVPGSWVQRPRGVELTPDEGSRSRSSSSTAAPTPSTGTPAWAPTKARRSCSPGRAARCGW